MSLVTVTTALPFVARTVNAYLIRHAQGLAMIDTGPHTPRAYLDVREEISALGCTPADVGHIVITHGHWDHFGLASRLKCSSSASICYHAADRSRIAEDPLRQPGFEAAAEHRLRQMGFAEEFIRSSDHIYKAATGKQWNLHQPVAADAHLADGDLLPIGDELLEVIHTPGHTPGSICLYNRAREVLFVGDHVFTQATVESALEILVSSPPAEEAVLLQYLNSLDKIASLPVQTFYPGHGLPGGNLRDRVEAIKSGLEGQCAHILACLDDEPRTALQISQVYWQSTSGSLGIFSQVNQVVYHLRLLVARAQVRVESRPDDAVYYSRS